jgi:hypothetical protein
MRLSPHRTKISIRHSVAGKARQRNPGHYMCGTKVPLLCYLPRFRCSAVPAATGMTGGDICVFCRICFALKFQNNHTYNTGRHSVAGKARQRNPGHCMCGTKVPPLYYLPRFRCSAVPAATGMTDCDIYVSAVTKLLIQ